MSTNEITQKEKKLAMVRRILWICFGSLVAASLFCSIPLYVLWRSPEMGPPTSELVGGPIFLYMPFWGMLFFAAFSGVVCFLIYTVIKYRVEQEDDLFM